MDRPALRGITAHRQETSLEDLRAILPSVPQEALVDLPAIPRSVHLGICIWMDRAVFSLMVVVPHQQTSLEDLQVIHPSVPPEIFCRLLSIPHQEIVGVP